MTIRSIMSLSRKVRRWFRGVGVDGLGAGAAAAAGDVARDRQDYRTAAEHYRRALEAKPDWTAIRVQFANMLKDSSEPAAAEEQYKIAIGAEPRNADTHLQLGHALKMQSRYAEARDAYLAAACLDPELQAARTELRATGMSDTVVERHIAATLESRSPSEKATRRQVSRERRPIASDGRPPLQGVIQQIGRTFVSGMIEDVGADDLPLSIFCRDGRRDVAVLIVERDEVDGPTALPRTIPFRLDLADAGPTGVLRITIEPLGSELSGSPLVLPNESGSALMERVARLEQLLERAIPPADLAVQLERQLAPRLTQIAADRIERIIRQQRETFERQLSAIEAGREGRSAISPPAPPSVEWLANDAFPGLGWGAPSTAPGGIAARRVSGRAWLSERLATGCGAVLEAVMPAATSRMQLSRVTVGAAGNRLPFWTEYCEGRNGNAAHWHMAALVPPEAIEADGSVTCFLDYATGFADAEGVAVSAVRLHSLPLCALSEIQWSELGWPVLQGAGEQQSRIMLVLPGLKKAGSGTLELELAGDAEPLALYLNDVPLEPTPPGSPRLRLPVPPSAWFIGRPNLLRIDFADITTAPVTRLAGLRVLGG